MRCAGQGRLNAKLKRALAAATDNTMVPSDALVAELRHLSRAAPGKQVDYREHDSWEDYLCHTQPQRIYLFTTKATQPHWSVDYKRGDHLLFGSESSGVPDYVHDYVSGDNCAHGQRVCLPIAPEVDGRSLNLASTAMTAIYEGLRGVTMDEGALPWSP